jgi:formylglycine-generating enzyme
MLCTGIVLILCLLSILEITKADETCVNSVPSDTLDALDEDGSDCGCNVNRDSVERASDTTGTASSSPRSPDDEGRLELLSEVIKHHEEEKKKNTSSSSWSSTGNSMVYIPGRSFKMGTDNPKIFADGESPARPVLVSSFYMDKYEVSNEEYMQFVDATGYQTDSEKYGWSFVFHASIEKSLKESIQSAVKGAEWWLPVQGSSWREPEGPGTDVFDTNRADHPAIHISWTDADEYCKWRNNSRLPTEAEWELAARGSTNDKVTIFPWGNVFEPKSKSESTDNTSVDTRYYANIYHGKFPNDNSALDGYKSTAPVHAYGPQNDYGLYNMIGNAWEWCSDWWVRDHKYMMLDPALLVNPQGPEHGDEKVKKGGSFLCHKSYCYRYRVAARHKTSIDSASQNSGFRCAKSIS